MGKEACCWLNALESLGQQLILGRLLRVGVKLVFVFIGIRVNLIFVSWDLLRTLTAC